MWRSAGFLISFWLMYDFAAEKRQPVLAKQSIPQRLLDLVSMVQNYRQNI